MLFLNNGRHRSLAILISALSLLALVIVCTWVKRSRAVGGKPTFLAPDSVSLALCLYKLDVGHFPVSLDALIKGSGIRGWKGPYLRADVILPDAWGTPLRYGRAAQGYELRSAGRDRKFATPDDEVVSRSE